MRSTQHHLTATLAFALAPLTLALALAGCGGGGGGDDKTPPPGGSTFPGANPGGTVPNPTTGTGTTTPGTTFALVTNFTGDAVDVYDVATAQPVTGIFTTGGPVDVSIDAGKTAFYVPHLKTKSLLAFDSVSYAQTQTIDLSMAPMSQYPQLGILDSIFRYGYRPTGAVEAVPGKVYVPGIFSVTVVQNGAPVKGIIDLDLSMAMSSPPGFFDLLTAPVESLGAFRAAAANGKVYVTNFLADTVSVIDTVTDDVVETILVGNAPAGIVIDKHGVAYVTCAFSGDVYTFDTTTNQVGNVISMVGVGPIDIAYDPTNDAIYVSNYLSGDIAKIDALTHQVIDTYAPSSMQSLMSAMGLSPATMQTMLNQILSGLGTAGTGGGTSSGGLMTFINALLGGSGTSSGGGIIGGILSQVLNTFFAQLGGTGGSIPVAGIMGLDVTDAGTTLVVSNSVTGEVSFINTTTKAITSYMPMLGGAGGSTIPFPVVTSVDCFTR